MGRFSSHPIRVRWSLRVEFGARSEDHHIRAAQPAGMHSAVRRLLAPLAQSAERLHGKEKVYGSIP